MPLPEKRILEFNNKAFGLFIHYGLYSLLGRGEWVMEKEHIPTKEYMKLMDRFDCKGFDSDAIALMCKNAGARYITITTRHHDGFSLYDTRGLNTYDSVHSAAKRDIIYELARSCDKYGIMLLFYHTTLDWNNRLFNEDFNGYLQYLRQSIEVLCRNYGRVGGFWFDGNWSKDVNWQEDALYSLIRKYQPESIIINNTGLSKLGELGNKELDSVTFERGRPKPINLEGSSKYIASEMCQILDDHWGYAENDLNYKSLANIIEDLAQCRRYGANYLLNIGPMGDGSIRNIDKAYFEELGKWTGMYASSVYGTVPDTDVTCSDNAFVLRRNDGRRYLFVRDMTISDEIKIIDIYGLGDIRSIRWLDNGEALSYKISEDKISVDCTQYKYGYNYVVRVAEII